MDYILETQKAMTWLGKKEDTMFLGQTVECSGSPMFKSLEKVDMKKRLELPVIEDCQMGMSIGLALEGLIPVSIFPRMDFLICATNQLVNHLDKIGEMSDGEFNPGVIIRTQIGNTTPLNPGPQHCGDYTMALKKMCKNIVIIKIKTAEEVIDRYKDAYHAAKMGISTMLIETPQGGKNPNKK